MSLKQQVNEILRDIENPDGKGIMVSFDERPWYNKEESEKQGRPVYENRVYITKHIDNLSVRIQPALQDYPSVPRPDLAWPYLRPLVWQPIRTVQCQCWIRESRPLSM